MVSYLLAGMRRESLLNSHFPDTDRMRPIIASILLLAFTSPLTADEIPLYRGEAVVQDKQASTRQAAMPEALDHSVSRITGLRTLREVEGGAESLRGASSMVLSYYYRNREVLQPDGELREELRMVTEFSPQRVDQLVQDLQLPVWQAERDPVEVWLIVDDRGVRRILPEEWRYAWESMAQVAEDRGLPLAWPKADEEGMYPVDSQLLWGGYTEDLVGAGGTGVMIVAARREGATWNVRSNLQYRDDAWAWRTQDYDLQQILIESMHRAVDQVAEASAIVASDRGHWDYELTVTGLARGADYQRCLALLSDIGVIDSIGVTSAQAGRFRFRLDLTAMPRYLEQVLDSSRQFEAADTPGEYRFLP